jgi:DNA-binding SARP family transcriptional activator
MPTVRLQVLGGFSVSADDRVLIGEAWPRSRARAVLKLLGASPGHRLHREQVMDAVWPDLSPEGASAQLYKAVHFIRVKLAGEGVEPIIRVADERVELLGAVAVDVDRFRREAGRCLDEGSSAACRGALAAYQGDLLPDDLLEDWTEPARADLARMRRAVQHRLLRE